MSNTLQMFGIMYNNIIIDHRELNIVFFWSQYDGGIIEQRTIGYDCRQNQETKPKIVGGLIYNINTSLKLSSLVLRSNHSALKTT